MEKHRNVLGFPLKSYLEDLGPSLKDIDLCLDACYLSEQPNLAYQKSTSQNCEYADGYDDSQYAVDGDLKTRPVWESCTTADNWLLIDLGADYNIGYIKVTNYDKEGMTHVMNVIAKALIV